MDVISNWVQVALEPLSFSFLRRALVGGVLAGLVCGIVGTWVVLRRIAFLGDALGHGIVPGVAVAVLLGVSPTLGAAVAAALMVVGISVLARDERVGEDTGIGLWFVGLLALGVIIISRSGTFAVDVTALLFGAVLGVEDADLVLAAVAAVVVVMISVVAYRPLLAMAMDPRQAELLGLRPGVTATVLLALVALAVVSSFQTVGALLVFALLIAPAATAALITGSVVRMMTAAVLLAWTSVVAGLFLSYHADLAAGGAIALWAVGQFMMTKVALNLRARRGRDHRPMMQT
ncbi:zinc ABC transporter permease AztB [Euzebya tangerina]|uniref:zinc ABC transporter permease AztB n=1 Tax=Euzebya tangerina TaxID=591198 RepID=UPI000E31A0F8|nr:zinc ABC transporter permease AztB [Euzebya tangerina]